MNYDILEDEIARWASAEFMVRALLLIGSRARNEHPAEKWGYPYPIPNQTRIQEWIEASLSGE